MIKTVFHIVFAFGLLLTAPVVHAKCMNCQPRLPVPTQARNVGQAVPHIDFAKSIEDLPVMQGLHVEDEKDVLFIFGNQRIAQTTLRGYVDIDQVYYFYWRTLKEMGWVDAGRNVYERAEERLTMKVSSADHGGQTVVTFAVQPIGFR